MALAFRLYGDFHWPPTAIAVDKDSSVPGVIEIHYAESDGENHGRPFLRWFPGREPDPKPPANPSREDHLFDLTPQDAAKWLADRREKDCAIWLDTAKAPSSLKKQVWVVFRGAFLFEQYRAPKKGEGDKAVLNLQWPLVTQCEYQKGKRVYSSLGICCETKPLFYFSLHLPFPVRRTSLSGGTAVNARAFPFSAVFDLAPKKADDWRGINALVAGWKEGDALPDLTSAESTCFPFEGNKRPEKMELGRFGFSEYGAAPGGDFALYGLADNATGQYWPRNRQALLQDILWRYGFSLDYDSVTWLQATGLGRHDLSLRFLELKAGGGGQSHRSGMIYRASVERAANTADDTLEFQSDDKGFRLRLVDEIAGRIAAGTQFGAIDTPSVEDAAAIDGWLRVGDTLSADCELSWEIARGDIWSDDRSAAWSPRIAVRLHWIETVDSVKAAPAAPKQEFHAGLLAQANFSFAATRAALEPGETGQPHSFLPDLSMAQSKPVRFALYGAPVPAGFRKKAKDSLDKEDNAIVWGRAEPTKALPSPPWRRPPMRLSLANPDHLIDEAERKRALPLLRVNARGMTFFQTPDVKIVLTLEHDEKWLPQGVESIEDGDPFFASFTLGASPADAWNGRLSSLQFVGDKGAKDSAKKGHLRTGGRGARLGLGDGAPILTYPDGRIAAELRLPIPVAKVEPIGVDVARNDRTGRPAPLLIPLERPVKDGKSPPNTFWLTAVETLSPTQDRKLEADISEDLQEIGARSYVVLSSEPFTVYRFTQRALADRGRADDASVAFYSGDNRIWQYKRVSDYYHYVLPPQSIGESADKPRRLEIHDLPEGSTESPPRPAVNDLQRRAVEYRLTPSAEIWIRPSDVQRGYFMPESASYEIFRQFGELGLGAALAFLRAEFLYGLSVGIDVSAERSIARGARVAEIEALTGRLTGPAREPAAEATLVNRWNALRAAVARRPERLEIWARDLDSVIDFTPARFSDGVRFALRHSALHRAPLIDKSTLEDGIVPESADDYQLAPKVAGFDASRLPPELEAHPRHHPQGLSGGALWPAESLNLFRNLLGAPQSTGGTIESIALSPLGGDAAQKALFLNGKVTIISQTRNGYVERQQVEVLGRICAFWHRAKHVVVYERTVNPSAQFAPKLKEDPHRTRSRRPILRKVREYIELLQPERNYPDFSTAAPRSAGFLQRVRFNSRIINVDSAWSSEVDNDGWQIPLWNRLAARERPQVYPMPDVAFVSTAEGDGEKPVVAQECLDPDYLFFFADVGPDTSADTDTWKSRLNLDFPNMPAAQAIAPRSDAKSNEDPPDEGTADGRRRAVGRFLPGLRRFTWRLAPAAQKAAVNAGRGGKPVYAGLDSVTFMRATHTSDDHKKLGLLDGLFESEISKLHPDDEKPEIVALEYWDAGGKGAASPAAAQFAVKLEKVIKAAKENVADFPKARKDLYDLWNTSSLVTDVKNLASKIESKHFAGIPSIIKEGPGFCAKLKTDAVGMIQRKEMLVRTALQDWVAQADELLAEFKPYVAGATKTKVIEQLQGRAVAYIAPLFDEASKDVSKVEEGVEKSRAALIDLESEIENVIERARQRIQQCVNGYDQTKPWSPDRRKALRNGLQACVGNVRDDIAAAIDEARQRLGVELNEVSQAIGGHIAKQLKQIAALEADALERVTTIRRAVDRLFEQIDQTLERLLQDAAGGPGKLDELIKKINASNASDDLKGRAEKTLVAAKTACVDTQVRIADARTKATAVDNRAEEALNQVTDVIQALVESVKAVGAAIASSVMDLTKIANDLLGEKVDLGNEINTAVAEVQEKIDDVLKWPDQWLKSIGDQIDAMVVPATQYLHSILERARRELRAIPEKALPVINDVKQALEGVQEALGPSGLLRNVVADQIIRAALDQLLAPLPETIDPKELKQIEAATGRIRTQLDLLVETVGGLMRKFTGDTIDKVGQVTSACNAVFEGPAQAEAYLKQLATDAEAYVKKQLDDAFAAVRAKLDPFAGDIKDVAALVDAVRGFDRSVRGLQNNISRAYETARMYTDRVFDQFSKIGEGGVLAAPSNILKLYSAVTSAPEIAALKADIDRIRAGFDEVSDIIDTTKANALFNRLGDEMKALGLSLPFDKIGDRLLPADLSKVDIAKLFRNFGGAKFASMLRGYKVPAGVNDAIRVTHDFDKKQARAWVQIDINAPMAGRRSLFSVGIFKADFVDMRLTGQVRLEASKDTDKVTETGYGRIGTAIDLVVGGQSMVRFEKFGLNYTREKGLDVEFDPKNIRLNPSFKFIQDFLSSIFPDDIGGLEIIKQNGIPVGVQHDFAIPPMSLTFGTSGVSNICIENHFKLLAFPDFMIANRFNLSTVERPFIFSIFIIGGTGYIQIDAEYRPFDSELMVSVEAGAGGSATLAFAFGPFVGQVFITLSGALTYRKVIGRPGGGLSISVVLVIAGHVDVCGIITIGIVLMLRMTYRDSGQVDGQGSLSVTIRISKFFKISARAEVQYKLRGGKSEATVTGSVSGELSEEAQQKVDAVKSAAKKLEKARN